MKGLLLGALFIGCAFNARASCLDGFAVIGDPRNGAAYSTKVTVPGLEVSSALDQMLAIAAKEGFDVGHPHLTNGSGSLYFVQTKGLRLPLTFLMSAQPSGEVILTAKLARGQNVSADVMKEGFCRMLGQLKTGAAGVAAASAARTAHGTDRVIAVKAPELSAEMTKEIRKAATTAMKTPGLKDVLLNNAVGNDANDEQRAFSAVVSKYLGRKYRIDGQVYTTSQNRVAFLVTQTAGLLRVRQSDYHNNFNYTITCVLAPSENLLLASLHSRDWVTLEGTVSEVNPAGMRLKDCRQSR